MTELTDRQRVERGRRAAQALEEFLAEPIAEIEQDYMEKMVEVSATTNPRVPEILERLANGVKIARQIRARIEARVLDGKAVENEIERAKRIEQMSAPQRKLLNIAPH